MAKVDNIYGLNHRHQKYMLLGIAAFALLVGAAPRTERALFVFGPPEAPKAFAAIIPPAQSTLSTDTGAPSLFEQTFAPRGSRNPQPTAIASALPAAEPLPVGNTGSPVGPDSGPVQLASLPAALQGTPSSGPLSSASPPAFGPAAPATASAVTPPGTGTTVPGTGTTTPTGPGTGTSSTTSGVATSTPVAALPEPDAWLLMIVGFFGIGTMLRRNERESIEMKSVSLETQ